MIKKALNAYNTQYKQRCRQCGKYGHKPGNQRFSKAKMKKKKMKRKFDMKIRSLKEYATTVDRKDKSVKIVEHGETAIIKNLKEQKELLTEMERSWVFFKERK